MLQSGELTGFTVSELFRGNQQGGGESKFTPSPTQIRVNTKEKGRKGDFI